MPVRSVTACDNSRVITGSTMPSLLIHSDRGVYGVAMPPAMPAPIAGETVALFAAAPDMLAALEAALDAWRYQFDPPEDATQSDLQISGPDFIDWFAQWRENAKAVVAIAKAEGKL